MKDLLAIIGQIKPVEQSWIDKAMERQDRLTKPPQSLGKLEEIACRMAAIQQSLHPAVDRKRIVVFAGDHGVTEEGVSPYPAEVTSQMVANFLSGGAAINAVARTAGAELVIVDAGVKSPIPVIDISGKSVQFIQKPVRKGTRNFAREAALTPEETLSAIGLGLQVAVEAKHSGINLIGIGEMGIGNTTSAAAIAAALSGLPASAVTGRGTGAALAMSVIDAAVRAFVEMATFESAGVSDKQELAQGANR